MDGSGARKTKIEVRNLTKRFGDLLVLDEISFNVPFPLPGSSLFDRISGIDPTKDWSIENDVTFVYTSEFDPRGLRRRVRQTMRAFAEKRGLSPAG